jgi:23S rRNA pseudouridine2605 synthase
MEDDSGSEKGERIAKRLSRAGVCSRRDAEKWIAAGRVSVNGARLTTPATLVTEGDIVMVDGQVVGEAEPTRLFRYNKPRGLVTTNRDEMGRTTIYDRLPPELPRLITVGRLDLNSEGLLLMTNDGEVARHLELPATAWVRRYRVRAFGRVDQPMLDKLAKGITVEGVRYGPIEALLEDTRGGNSWITVGLQEGRNREIRRVFEHIGLTVSRLIRVAYGPFQLGKLPEGAIEEVPKRVIREQLGHFLNHTK